MDARAKRDLTTAERASDREFVVRRTFDAPARLVFEAWTTPELFRQWWTPKSFGMTILSCEIDARTGGSYRLMISHPAAPAPMAFFGRYIEVTPPSRIVWTNEEGEAEGAVTTVTFEEMGGRTLMVMRDLYPSKEALDEAMVSGATDGFSETFEQLDAVLAGQDASAGGS
jgi:uncharacterized protein YndB with AHSA1/START domain